MAVLDRNRGVLVIRVVYDGPAGAGKTTTVNALAAELGRPCVTPEERDGRTLYFDWLEYTAGGFEGYPIRCQVVSVPGQPVFARRRAYLLETADVIVYVVPVTQSNLPHVLASLKALSRPREGLPVGLVLQANKRDLAGALPTDRIREALSNARLPAALVETTATAGIGVRHAFVVAVRFALDRVREDLVRGKLRELKPEVDDPQTLLLQLRAADPRSAWSVSASGEGGRPGPAPSEQASMRFAGKAAVFVGGSALSTTRPLRGDEAQAPPALPDASVPAGNIWPPVEGRALLMAAITDAEPPQRAGSSWRTLTDSGWLLFSPLAAQFGDIEAGRRSLIQLARLHVEHARWLSAPRCIVLARDGRGGFRLWQFIRERLSLRRRLDSHRPAQGLPRTAQLILDTAGRLLALNRHLQADPESAPGLLATLDSAGVVGGATQYVGPIDMQLKPQPIDLVAELTPLLRGWRIELTGLNTEMQRIAGRSPQLAEAAAALVGRQAGSGIKRDSE